MTTPPAAGRDEGMDRSDPVMEALTVGEERGRRLACEEIARRMERLAGEFQGQRNELFRFTYGIWMRLGRDLETYTEHGRWSTDEETP